MSADDRNSIESSKPKTSRSNIDLFAAGERKIPKAPTNSTPTQAEKEVVVAAEKTKPSSVDVGVVSSGITDVATPASASVASPASSRNSMIELQAELLRLEAEREQLEIDQLRLDEEKVRY